MPVWQQCCRIFTAFLPYPGSRVRGKGRITSEDRKPKLGFAVDWVRESRNPCRAGGPAHLLLGRGFGTMSGWDLAADAGVM